MFDIGFGELVLVSVVSLLVFGPERLPRVAKEAALWLRKARSMVASVKSEIDQELQVQELRHSLLEEKRKLERETRALNRNGIARIIESDSKASLPKSNVTERNHEQE